MNESTSIIIAVDGLSASGKGTIAKKLAAHFDFAYLDTGLLYRATGLGVLRAGKKPSDPMAAVEVARNLDPSNIMKLADDPALRSDEASVAASEVGAIPSVRAALLKFQQDFAAHPPCGKRGAVLDGRDIGTIISPQAPVKLYITADQAIRANRRYKELLARGENVTETAVLADVRARDERDLTRAAAPAKPAEDAVILDTTSLTIDEAFEAALAIARTKIK